MNKYVFLYLTAENAGPGDRQAWMDWFDSIGEHVVDSGNPFGAGREVTAEGTEDLPMGTTLTGYSIVNADSMDHAEKLLVGCPMGVRVYETLSM